jgi:transposase InsO family protein
MAQLIRSDNGSKFIAKELQSWLEMLIGTSYLQPG